MRELCSALGYSVAFVVGETILFNRASIKATCFEQGISMYMNHLEQSTVELNDELKYNEWTEKKKHKENENGEKFKED